MPGSFAGVPGSFAGCPFQASGLALPRMVAVFLRKGVFYEWARNPVDAHAARPDDGAGDLMCLVQVEKAPKPLPACATPVTNGMKVWTHSESAVKAQKGVMEFLLINHPLECPICDQGGECQLQDLAVGYGGTQARYREEKRVWVNKNFGPLIASD